VRLADLSGGGPTVEREPVLSGEAPTGDVPFPPLRPAQGHSYRQSCSARSAETADQLPDPPSRPRLSGPSLHRIPECRAGAHRRCAARQAGSEVGLPDPDVETLEIQVAVRDPGLDDDVGFRTLYTATRKFPDDASLALALEVSFQDLHDVRVLPAAPDRGPLPLPTARDLRLTLTPVCRTDSRLDYFGSEDSRRGRSEVLDLRAHSSDERGLFAAQTPAAEFHVHMLRPDPLPGAHLAAVQAADGRQEEAAADMAQRLARAARLQARDLTFMGRPDQRTVFGCSRALRHLLCPDRSAITFASRADLTQHWISVLSLVLDRDWTWDALADSAFEVTRRIRQVHTGATETASVATIELPRAVHPIARATAGRAVTRIVFFDGVDPKPPAGAQPSELEITYTLTPFWKSSPAEGDPPFTAAMDLPMAIPPVQTPKLAAAGIALSPYDRAADYSSSEPRRRSLWLEFTEPVENPRDALFARVLAYALDPMLTGSEPAHPPAPAEPPLPLPEELIRTITRDQPADEAGLDAMQQLIDSDSPRHFFVPLPHGMPEESPDLFGFFVYELRIGHREGWSTAQARFGPPLRATGIQHPAAPLLCATARPSGISASSVYAMPVLDGRNLLPSSPQSEIWHLLYAQVMQVDGEDRRNVLLSRKRAEPLPRGTDARERLETVGIAQWTQLEIEIALRALNLPRMAPLSILGVELLPELDRKPDPLGADLGHVRIIRTSPLTPVGQICP
jgi:hypothetical protein